MRVNQAFLDYYGRFERARMTALAGNPALPAGLLLRVLEFREMRSYALHRASWPEDLFQAAAEHPDVHVRQGLADSHGLTPEQRTSLLDQPELVEYIATGRYYWSPAPYLTAAGYQRLATHDDPAVRLALAAAGHTPPELKGRPAAPRPAAPPEPSPPLGERARSAYDYERAAAAADPALPAALMAELATDPSHRVRLAVSMRPGLTEAERGAIDYHISPEARVHPVWWARSTADPAEIQACVESAHIGLRRSVAHNPHLTASQVAALGADDDYAVRLLLCENHDSAPSDTVLWAYLKGRHLSRTRLLRHPAFPRTGLSYLAGSDHPQARALVASDPEAPPDLIDRLSRDEHPRVRRRMAADPRLSAARVLELFEDEGASPGAAANPKLPGEVMAGIIDAYALLDDTSEGIAIWLGGGN